MIHRRDEKARKEQLCTKKCSELEGWVRFPRYNNNQGVDCDYYSEELSWVTVDAWKSFSFENIGREVNGTDTRVFNRYSRCQIPLMDT